MPAKPPGPIGISDMMSKIGKVAFTSHFLCEFTPPSNAVSFLNARGNAGFEGAKDSTENRDLIRLSCAEASLPGSSLATAEINNDYYGVTEKHVYRRLYDSQADFTFYVDKDYKIIDFFENWIAYASGEDSLSGQQSPDYSYRVPFPTDYKTENLYITKFERDYEGRPLIYKFINAFPVSINSMPVSYEASQLLKLTVSFSYSRYVISRSDGGTFPLGSGFESVATPVSQATLNGIDFGSIFDPNNVIPFA